MEKGIEALNIILRKVNRMIEAGERDLTRVLYCIEEQIDDLKRGL